MHIHKCRTRDDDWTCTHGVFVKFKTSSTCARHRAKEPTLNRDEYEANVCWTKTHQRSEYLSNKYRRNASSYSVNWNAGSNARGIKQINTVTLNKPVTNRYRIVKDWVQSRGYLIIIVLISHLKRTIWKMEMTSTLVTR